MSLPTQYTQTTLTPFDTMQKEFDTMLTQLFNPATGPARTGGRLADFFAVPVPVDVREDADHLYLEADLPGFAKDEIELTLEDNVLTLVAERKPATPEAAPKGEYLLNERRTARVQRSFKLPPTIGDQSVNATLVDGVLTVTLAKREESKPRRISVQ